MKQLIRLWLVSFLALPTWVSAQIGGKNVYQFLDLSPSARITGLAGNAITVRDDDASLAFQNPAALNPLMHQSLSFNHNFFLTEIQHGYASYAHNAPRWGVTFHGGIQYVDYGKFDRTDEFGNTDGTFSAGEYAITLGAGRQLYDRLSVGGNLKVISSALENYNSFGMTTDWAAMYFDTASRFALTLLFKNVGGQITTYREGNQETIPFEMQIGFSKRLKHLPFRFSIIYHHLNRWNILYDDPNSSEPDPLFPDAAQDGPNPFVDNLLRHFIFNGEFLFGKKENFRLRLGYNHFRHREMTVKNFRSLAGFSFGAGIKINRFRLDYGREIWHIAGGVNHVSISTNIQEFRK